MTASRNLNRKLKRDHNKLVTLAIEMHNNGKSPEITSEVDKIMNRVKLRENSYPGTWEYFKNQQLRDDLLQGIKIREQGESDD